MAMATIGIFQIPTSKTLISSKSSTSLHRSTSPRLSSSSSQLAGEKLSSTAVLRPRNCPSSGRSPILVSPKAVSDSKNSQTCLDPAASVSVLGVILGGGAGTRLYPLTKKRAKPAVPLGANYRLIDIPVSNCLNSNISKIYVLTQFNSASLNRHLSRAYASNMGGYKNEGFVEVLAAQQSPENPNWFQAYDDTGQVASSANLCLPVNGCEGDLLPQKEAFQQPSEDPSDDRPWIPVSNKRKGRSDLNRGQRVPSQPATEVRRPTVRPYASDKFRKGFPSTRFGGESKGFSLNSKPSSWASIVSGDFKRDEDCRLQYIEPSFCDGSAVAKISNEETLFSADRWANTLMFYVVRQRPHYPYLKAYILRMWKPASAWELYSRENGFFLVKFADGADCSRILAEGPWLYDGRLVIIRRWSKDLKFDRDLLKSLPLWVRLPGLNLQLWNPTSISRIVSIIGTPLYMDGPTAKMDRISFARVFVDVSADRSLPQSVNIQLEDGQSLTQEILYEWKPPHCSKCKFFGHVASLCTIVLQDKWVPVSDKSSLSIGLNSKPMMVEEEDSIPPPDEPNLGVAPPGSMEEDDRRSDPEVHCVTRSQDDEGSVLNLAAPEPTPAPQDNVAKPPQIRHEESARGKSGSWPKRGFLSKGLGGSRKLNKTTIFEELDALNDDEDLIEEDEDMRSDSDDRTCSTESTRVNPQWEEMMAALMKDKDKKGTGKKKKVACEQKGRKMALRSTNKS